jgi:hypothetical protein
MFNTISIPKWRKLSAFGGFVEDLHKKTNYTTGDIGNLLMRSRLGTAKKRK